MMPLPFAGGIEATANATLLFSLAAAVVFVCAPDGPPRLSRSAARAGSVGLLALLAFLQGGPFLLVAALVLSAAGDAFWSREGERALLGGLAAFFAAHIAYVVLFLRMGDGAAGFLAEPWRSGLALAMTVLVLATLRFSRWRVSKAWRLPLAARIMAILAAGLAALTTHALALIGGGVLFVVSEALLALARGRGLARRAAWIFYYAAQVIIVLGFLLA